MGYDIYLSDLSFYSFHGVFPFEREYGNEFKVDLRVTVNSDPFNLNDDLSNTISYADIYKEIETEMAYPSDLLETVAANIACRLKNRWKEIESGEIKITKLKAPIPNFKGNVAISLKF